MKPSKKNEYLGFLDCASMLYKEALKLVNPGNDRGATISGCIVMIIALEKLIKHVLELKSPLMVLEKISFDDVKKVCEGGKVGEKHTVSLSVAYGRLSTIFLELASENHWMIEIVKDRNFLVHQAGFFDLANIESRVRVNVADITEKICLLCLSKKPDKLLGKAVWDKMDKYRSAYKDAEVLELKQRIAFLKKLYESGKKLPCELIEKNFEDIQDYDGCPICGKMANVHLGVDVDYGPEGIEGGGYYIGAFDCNNCGFSMSDSRDIEALIGKEAVNELLYPEPEPDWDYDR